MVVRRVVLVVLAAVLCAGAVSALAGSADASLEPMTMAMGAEDADRVIASDAADAENVGAMLEADAEADADSESESESTEVDANVDVDLDSVEAEWLSPSDAAFLQMSDAEADAAEQEADDEDAVDDAAEADAADDADVDADDEEGEGAADSLVEVDADKDGKKKKKKRAKKYVVPCDITAKRGICLFDGQKVLVPDAVPKGLVARYTFDDAHAIDSSRHGNHGAKRVVSAPGRGGAGFSASFNGKNRLPIPHSKSLGQLSEFSLSFWLYFPESLDPNMPKDCPIIAKGKSNNEKLFSISVDGKSRTLSFHSLNGAGRVSSRARVGPHRWTHVTAVRSSSTLSLFLHGVLDSQESNGGGVQEPPSSLHIGRVPWTDAKCNVPFFIDDLRIFKRALSRSEIEAESYPSLGAVEPSFAHLGCLSCGYGDAVGSCRSGYHLCSTTELHAGGYHVARAMGWGDANTQIWHNAGNSNPPPGARLAMCCGGL